jgi:uncharacterized protein (TIGR02231 family)
MGLALALALLAGPVSADVILARSNITGVTVYPQGAKVERMVEFTAPAGRHELVITDMPQATDPSSLRVDPGAGLQIGSIALRQDRLPARDVPKSDAILAAEAAREVALNNVVAAKAGVEAVMARVQAAEAQIQFLQSVGPNVTSLDAQSLQAAAAMIGSQTLAAAEAALAAKTGLPAAQKGLTQAQEDLAKADAALAALSSVDEDYAALTLAVAQATDGTARLVITHFMPQATWSPIYDLQLDRAASSLMLDRAMLVSQSTGEDWAGVVLTLSTAQPGQSPDPATLWPRLERIGDPAPMAESRMAQADGTAALAEPAMELQMAGFAPMKMNFQGDTVTYTYPDAVDVADGVDNLRLALDEMIFPAKVTARAVPQANRTAYMMAEFTNASGQILLPGPVMLTRDGAFVGGSNFELMAPGAEATIGFGAIEGLRLKRTMPERAEGDRGVFSKSSQIEETATLEVENLTPEDWDVRVLDQVPYSEQEDLVITYTTTPPVSEVDVENQRGILGWDIQVAAGAKTQIKLQSKMSWPEGKVLE